MPPSFIIGQVHGLIWHGLEAIRKFLTLSSDYEEDYYDYLVSISSLSLFIAKLDNYVWVYDEHVVGEQNIRQSNMSNVIPVIKTWKQKIRSRKTYFVSTRMMYSTHEHGHERTSGDQSKHVNKLQIKHSIAGVEVCRRWKF